MWYRIAVILQIVVLGGCSNHPTVPPNRLLETHEFPVDVTLTKTNQGWGHFTTKDYYNPKEFGTIKVYVTATYNKPKVSPGFYGWMRTSFADSAGNFDNNQSEDMFQTLIANTDQCAAYLLPDSPDSTAFLGEIRGFSPLLGGPGSGYSIGIYLAEAVFDAVNLPSCVADSVLAADDTLHISKITYKLLSIR